MKALSLHQPWASLIAMGVKTIETRSWSTSHRGLLAIHAAKKRPTQGQRVGDFTVDWGLDASLGGFVNGGFDEGCGYLLVDAASDTEPLPLGAIVATSRLVEVFPTESLYDRQRFAEQAFFDSSPPPTSWDLEVNWPLGDFSPGRFAWFLDDVSPVTDPVPAKGAQRLWEWSK